MRKIDIQEYVDYLQMANKASKTIEVYTPIVASFLQYCNQKPSAVSKKNIIKFILFKEGTRTREQRKGAISHLYKGVLNEAHKMKGIPNPKREQYIPNILSMDEAAKITENIVNLKHHSLINLQYFGALRTSEVLNLKITDIRKDGVIHIRQSKGARDRMVPLPQNTIKLLRKYYSAYKPTEYLFNGQDSLKYSAGSIQKIVKVNCLRNGIHRKIRPHDLRHSRATHLHIKGVGIKFIQELLGHKKITTTEMYLHSNTEILKEQILQYDY
ncbi:tyrosine-type recombinase/integrase [Aequorivita echinoideorum]|uniref:Tyrosine-type recombinase/integrase n=1 Tax=Aequorivita echinoideorum TaxID=1549647 RepID=A0ABS5S335_9FLAO|nr:tyrosine-type recombinase/integrase [Aequorivita echinoideorum]MBT0607628.1 tyrosine-type recombinase/integrase [Aequorivita echinoideorum]